MNKKEYALQINGVDKAIKDFTSLEEVVRKFDETLKNASGITVEAVTASVKKTKALTDEEKAAKKLEETVKKVKAAQEGANDAQIKANQALREATREQTLRVRSEKASINSLEGMRIELSRLKDEWKHLDTGTVEFREMSEEIDALNTKIKTAEQSVGDFRRNVGNYESALQGLGKLSAGIDGISKTTQGMAQSLMGGIALMSLFGDESEENAEKTRQLQKIIALLSIAQQANNNLLKSGTLLKLKEAAAEKARAAATQIATVATNLSSKAVNLFSKALVATGIGAIVVGLGLLIANFDKLKKIVTDNIPALNGAGSALDKIKAIASGVGKAITDYLLTPFRTIAAVVKKLLEGDIKGAFAAGLVEMKRGLNVVENYQTGYNDRVAANAEKRKLAILKESAEELENLIKDNEAKYGSEWRYTQEARKLYEDLFAQKKKLYENDKEASRELFREESRYLYDLRRQDEEAVKKSRETAAEAHKKALDELKERQRAELEAVRNAEDDRTVLISDSFDRRRAEIQIKYDRQREDLQKQLDENTNLTETARNAIREVIENINKHIQADMDKVRLDELEAEKEQTKKIIDEKKRLGALQLQELESFNKKAETIRDENGLIDVRATRENISNVNSALDDYIAGLRSYQTAVSEVNAETLATFEKGSIEYREELQRQAKEHEDVARRIKEAQKEQAENTEQSADLQIEYLKDLFEKIGEYADAAFMAVSSVRDTWNMGLQAQVDELNKQLDALNERYEEAQKQREEAVKNVETIEARLQAATGGTAEALKSQLQDAMHARAEANREEQRLAKEKEKREAEIAKKEKQIKRNDLIVNIAQAIANTAQGVTSALKYGIPGLVIAAIIGATGAVQVGIMTKQLAKLADGGEIKGPSHANGGVPIAGTNYEVEGGEFVVNKRSYGANANLVNFINETPRVITAADLFGVVPGNNTPVIVTDTGGMSDERIVDAIKGINMQPVVSVTDINDTGDEVVAVKDLANF